MSLRISHIVLVSISLALASITPLSAVTIDFAQDQDAALKARKNAKLVPYGKITELIKKEFGGRIAHQKLVQTKKGQWVYQLRVLNQQNKVMNVQVDAETGKILKTQKGKK